jgi:hypothetical protein
MDLLGLRFVLRKRNEEFHFNQNPETISNVALDSGFAISARPE